MPVCSIVILFPLNTVDDLIHYCTRPSAWCNRLSTAPRGNSFDYTTNKHEITYTIHWHYTKAWFRASLLKTHRHLLAYWTTMRVRFVYEKRRCTTMVKMRHGLATSNSNNSVVFDQKHKVWFLVFLVRTSGTF